jgi:hypothetical protein
LRKEAQIRGNSALKLETHPILNCRMRCYFTKFKKHDNSGKKLSWMEC